MVEITELELIADEDAKEHQIDLSEWHHFCDGEGERPTPPQRAVTYFRLNPGCLKGTVYPAELIVNLVIVGVALDEIIKRQPDWIRHYDDVLGLAAMERCWALVGRMLEEGAKPSRVRAAYDSRQDNEDAPAELLAYTVTFGEDFNILECADPEWAAGNLDAALTIAALYDDLDACKELLRRGAKIAAAPSYRSFPRLSELIEEGAANTPCSVYLQSVYLEAQRNRPIGFRAGDALGL